MAIKELTSIRFPDLGDEYKVKVTQQVLNESLQALTEEVDNKIDTAKTEINNAIDTEVSNRNTAISNAIDTEVDNRNNAIDEALSEYAKVDGYYEEMAVGSAEQLLSTQFVEDSVPYKFRTSGGSKDIGNREYDEIVGGSIVWNQLQANTTSRTIDGITFTYTNGSLRVNGTATQIVWWLSGGTTWDFYKNHIYLLDTGNDNYVGDSNKWVWYVPDRFPSSLIRPREIVKASSDGKSYFQMMVRGGNPIDMTFKPQVFDLTAMFGSTVADYIYSLETAQSGKGVAFFKSLFPNDYYPYNAGELLSVEGLQSHDTAGFNQWDEEWELGTISNTGENVSSTTEIRSKNYIPILPNTAYFLGCATAGTFNYRFYDSNKAFISFGYIGRNSTLTTPSNASYMRFYMGSAYGNVYKNDICINLSWSGWRNGEYEPYKKHSYPLDSSLTLRGMLKLNAQNELYFDGDIYSHDGKVTRKYKEVLINGDGSYSFGMNGKSTDSSLFYIIFNDKKNGRYNMVSDRFMVPSSGSSGAGLMNGRDGSGLVEFSLPLTVNQDSASANAWFSANPTRLIYELATPTEETAEPFEEVQIVDDFGTEEYISGNLVPVGHNTKYPANLRDKLQHLPNMADSDGAYLIRQTNKQMSLEVFRIPKAPTIDGTYILKATVSGGTPTYIWEAVE